MTRLIRIICVMLVWAALSVPAYGQTGNTIEYDFGRRVLVRQGEENFVCEYPAYQNSIHQASAWEGGAALRLTSDITVPPEDSDGRIAYTYAVSVERDGIYRMVLQATRPAADEYFSDWTLEVNGESAAVIAGTTKENNQTFANWADVRLRAGNNTMTIRIAPRQRGGGFWFILDYFQLHDYGPAGMVWDFPDRICFDEAYNSAYSSGREMLRFVDSAPGKDTVREVRIPAVVENGGIYQLNLTAGQLDQGYLSQYSLFVNDVEYGPDFLKKCCTGSAADTTGDRQFLRNYRFAVTLRAGENTIAFRACPDRANQTRIWLFLDQIQFTPADSPAVKIVGVFAQGETVLARVQNNGTDDFFADGLLATYRDGQLIQVEKETVPLYAGQAAEIPFPYAGARETDTVKAFLWMAGTQVPCAESLETKFAGLQTAALNVVEQGKGGTLQFAVTGLESIAYTIYDYFGNQVLADTALVSEGSCSVSIPTDMESGWYRITAGNQVLAAFAVVPPRNQEIDPADTPFATDFAAAWLVKNGGSVDLEGVEEYCRAIQLAGIGWVRERVSPGSINPAQGIYDFSGLRQTTDIMNRHGLKVSGVFHSSPDWTLEQDAKLSGDLRHIYDYMRNSAVEMEGQVHGWEIWNEQDEQLYAAEPADRYGAYFKAAALGAAAAGTDAYKVLGGIAQSPLNSDFSLQLMENGVMDYADCYNYHAYAKDTGQRFALPPNASMQAHYAQQSVFNQNHAGVWVTEYGVHCSVEEGGKDLAMPQKEVQARYAVTGATSALAAGVDKAFWFVMPSYQENNKNFGAFTSERQPNPAYAAMAVMTRQLGKGEYTGEIKLGVGVHAYAFDTGRGKTAVIWADTQREIRIAASGKALLYDMMGRQRDLPAEDGFALLSVGVDPVYVDLGEEIIDARFYPQQYPAPQTPKSAFRDVQKIVISPKPETVNDTEAKLRGYRIKQIDQIPVEIYNFSDKVMQGRIEAVAEFAGSVTIEAPVTIPAMGKIVVYADVNASEIISEIPYNIRFTGIFEGEETSPCTMDVIFSYPESKIDEIRFYKKDWQTSTEAAEAWNVSNISGGGASVREENGLVTFRAAFTTAGKDNWFYPTFKTPPNYNGQIEHSKGFSFTVTADADAKDVYMNAMLYYDGAASLFFLGTRPYPLQAGTHTYFVPWDAFVYHNGTDGRERKVDPKKVTSISVGLNTRSAGAVTYAVSHVGYYMEPREKPVRSVSIQNVPDGEEIDREDLEAAAAAYEGDFTESNMYINGQPASLAGLTELEKGKYTLTASGSSRYGGTVWDTKTFYVR